MEVDESQTQACKFSRVGNGRNDSSKIGHQKGSDQQYPDDEDGEIKRSVVVAAGRDDSGGGGGGGGNRLRGWHHSSRIIRVSRASGGKDRHSKVWTSKGLRDRRVRLSVTTAIQFYDLQDRLGYDQPSKAVEWLIKSASDAIAELPSLNSAFPDTPKQLSDEKRASNEHGFDSADVEIDGETNFGQSQNQNQNQQHLSLSKSACSSTSETSKGSGLSLSRSEIRVNRVKARERARERAAKDKEKENESRIAHHHQNVNPISQNSSFTELLTGGISSVNSNNNNNNNNNSNTSPTGSAHQNPNGEPNLFHKAAAVARHWSAAPMDYFSTGFLGQPLSSRTHHSSGGFPGQIQLGNSLPHTMSMSIPTFNVSGENNHQELPPHYPFVDHLIPVTTQPGAGGGDYNLNFTISSSGLAGFNRGTLQSNLSPSHLPPNLQRFASPIDGSNVPFLMGTTTTPPVENHHHHHHHQFSPGFDGRLQLRYGDGSSRHSDQKGKGKH